MNNQLDRRKFILCHKFVPEFRNLELQKKGAVMILKQSKKIRREFSPALVQERVLSNNNFVSFLPRLLKINKPNMSRNIQLTLPSDYTDRVIPKLKELDGLIGPRVHRKISIEPLGDVLDF